MKITYYNDDIPDWLKPHMPVFCKCGGVMADDGPVDYRGVMKLTQRFCLNPHCPYHMAEKIQMLAKYFKVDGIGPETARNMIEGYKFRSHLDALKFWFGEPPEVYLYEVGELSYIYGIKSKWKDILAGYRSFEEYFDTVTDIPDVVESNKDYLLECQSYFRLKKDVISQSVLRIMITGSLHGFSSRQEFLGFVNERYKNYFRVEDNKKTIRNTYCLVKEPESVDYSKTAIAVHNGIQIMSSSEFLAILEYLKEEIDSENEGVHRQVLSGTEDAVEENGEDISARGVTE